MQGDARRRDDSGESEAVPPEELERILDLVQAAHDRAAAAEAEAARLHALLDGLLAKVPPVVVVEGGRVAAWSAAMERHTGKSAGAALGQNVTRALPGLAVRDGVHLLEVADGELRPLHDHEPVYADAEALSPG